MKNLGFNLDITSSQNNDFKKDYLVQVNHRSMICLYAQMFPDKLLYVRVENARPIFKDAVDLEKPMYIDSRFKLIYTALDGNLSQLDLTPYIQDKDADIYLRDISINDLYDIVLQRSIALMNSQDVDYIIEIIHQFNQMMQDHPVLVEKKGFVKSVMSRKGVRFKAGDIIIFDNINYPLIGVVLPIQIDFNKLNKISISVPYNSLSTQSMGIPMNQITHLHLNILDDEDKLPMLSEIVNQLMNKENQS